MFLNLKSLLFLLFGINVFILVGYNYNILTDYKSHRCKTFISKPHLLTKSLADTFNLHVQAPEYITGSEHVDEVTREQVLEASKELEDQSFQIHLKRIRLNKLLEQIEIKELGEALSGELKLQRGELSSNSIIPFNS